jgi:hypothetical protein
MHFNNILPKIPVFWKIWILHILVYFLLLSILIIIQDFNANAVTNRMTVTKIISTLLGSSLIGFFGFFDGIGFFIIFTMIVMFIINLKIKNNFFSYVLSILVTYPFYMYFIENDGYGSNMKTIISLIITVTINLLVNIKSLNRR